MKKFSALALLLAAALGLNACAGLKPTEPVPQQPVTPTESRWLATLRTPDFEQMMNVLVLPEEGGGCHLLLLSEASSALGECSLGAGELAGSCSAVAGAQPAVEKVAMAFSALLEKSPAYIHNPKAKSGRLATDSWQASRDALGGIEFQALEEPGWTLELRRMAR